MASQRSVFYGFGAWVGQITGATTCAWWAEDPSSHAFDVTRSISVNLANNPEAYRTKQLASIDLIEVDDQPKHGGLTKIGPSWPAGAWINSCWLQSEFYRQLKCAPPRLGSDDECYEYELTSVLYWDGPLQGRRFYGHYVEIESEKGNHALVSIWPAGRSRAVGQGAVRSIWMDLTRQHPIEQDFTQVGVGSALKKGPLFIDTDMTTTLMMASVKKPPGSGHAGFPRREAT